MYLSIELFADLFCMDQIFLLSVLSKLSLQLHG